MDKIYVVEDDPNIRELIVYALKNSGFLPLEFPDSQSLYEALLEDRPDLLILDIMLPGDDGFTILEKIRSNSRTRELPVIFLTAKTSEINRVRGLDLGADDYVLKPFSVMELISRVRAVLRRYKTCLKTRPSLAIGDLVLDPSRRTVSLGDRELDLTYKEFELLEYLMENKGLVLTRNMIMNKVWGFDFQGESRTIDVHIRSLRQKLGDHSPIIQTVRNLGYKIGV